MAINAINNIASSNNLILTFLVFEAYYCISTFSFLTLIIIQSVIGIKNTIKKVHKIRVEKPVGDILNQKNQFKLRVFFIFNLPLDLDILI